MIRSIYLVALAGYCVVGCSATAQVSDAERETFGDSADALQIGQTYGFRLLNQFYNTYPAGKRSRVIQRLIEQDLSDKFGPDPSRNWNKVIPDSGDREF